MRIYFSKKVDFLHFAGYNNKKRRSARIFCFGRPSSVKAAANVNGKAICVSIESSMMPEDRKGCAIATQSLLRPVPAHCGSSTAFAPKFVEADRTHPNCRFFEKTKISNDFLSLYGERMLGQVFSHAEFSWFVGLRFGESFQFGSMNPKETFSGGAANEPKLRSAKPTSRKFHLIEQHKEAQQ